MAPPQDNSALAALREKMVQEQIADRGITDPAILRAMRKVPRHFFVPASEVNQAYNDRAINIGPDQSISQPYVVALMLSELELKSNDRVLDVGTGSGYQTALLAEIVDKVFSVDIDPGLVEKAAQRIKDLGYKNVQLLCANGFDGWKEHAPFDAIVVSACPENIPRELVKQLRMHGRMILPLGEEDQVLVFLQKTESGLFSRELGGVRFVQMKDHD